MEFEGILLQPHGKWDASVLKDSVESIESMPVCVDERVVGEVVDSEYADGEGIQCTIEVWDDSVAEMVDQTDSVFAPTIVYDRDEGPSSADFQYAFPTDCPSDDVGDFNRKI